jgi:predicted peptidase
MSVRNVWSKYPESQDDMVAVPHAILRKTLQERPIDPACVYVSGVSAGSSAVWEMALRFPSVFAAVVPMASGGNAPFRAARLANIPVQVFHNRNDSGTSSTGDEEMVAALGRAGGNVHLTLGVKAYADSPEVSEGHDCWSTATRCHHIMDWMLEQRRGAWICWTPSGRRLWKWWHILGVSVAFLAIVGVALHSQRRQACRRD